MKKRIDRRSFLRIGALGTLAAGLPARPIRANPSAPGQTTVSRYVPLGRTGLNISPVSFGSSRLRDGQEKLVDHALDRGINYFDTAESYTGGSSETVLGNALSGKRDKVVLASKMSAGADEQQNSMMEVLEQSLRRLRTDYVDIMFNHAVNDIARLHNDQWLEFAERAKAQGKIRYTGMSGHAGRLVECLDYALDEDMFDVILVAYNFGQDPAFYEKFTRPFDFVAKQPELPRVLAKARQKQVGVIAMKVLRGARLNDMRPFEISGRTYAQAALRWVLSNQDVDAAIISMTSTELIDEYLGGTDELQVSDDDFRLLEQYARLTDNTYCRHGCNDCEGVCPFNVPIADVLRTRMYGTDYGDLAFARAEYNLLDKSAADCLSCDGQPCQNACSHGIQIAKLCGPTHVMLS